MTRGKQKEIMTKEIKTKRNKLIANEALAGKSQKEIAEHHDISRSQVSRILDRDEIKEILNKGMTDQVRLVPKATEVLEGCLSDDDPKIRLSSAGTVFKNTGLAPTHGPNIHIDKLIQQDNRTQSVQIDGLQEFMAYKYRDVGADDPIRVTGSDSSLEDKEDSTDSGDTEKTDTKEGE